MRPRREGEADLRNIVRRVVVPLDGSHYSEEILPAAEFLAEAFAANILLMHVVGPPVMPPTALVRTRPPTMWGTAPSFVPGGDRTMGVCEPPSDSWLLRTLSHAEAELERIAGRLCSAAHPVATRIAIHEDPAAAILEESRPDVAVVLRTHAQKEVNHFQWGHVAGPIVHKAAGPVLISNSYACLTEDRTGLPQRPPAAQNGT